MHELFGGQHAKMETSACDWTPVALVHLLVLSHSKISGVVKGALGKGSIPDAPAISSHYRPSIFHGRGPSSNLRCHQKTPPDQCSYRPWFDGAQGGSGIQAVCFLGAPGMLPILAINISTNEHLRTARIRTGTESGN